MKNLVFLFALLVCLACRKEVIHPDCAAGDITVEGFVVNTAGEPYVDQKIVFKGIVSGMLGGSSTELFRTRTDDDGYYRFCLDSQIYPDSMRTQEFFNVSVKGMRFDSGNRANWARVYKGEMLPGTVIRNDLGPREK